MNEREYGELMNEGGEGYNPYREKREEEERVELAKIAQAYALTLQGKLDKLYRRAELECGSIARECGSIEEIDEIEDKLYAEIDNIEAEIEAEFVKVWTVEVTKIRRAEWNNFIKTEVTPLKNMQDKVLLIRERQQAQGWTMGKLKKAIKIHNL